jgi:hypothetical protein
MKHGEMQAAGLTASTALLDGPLFNTEFTEDHRGPRRIMNGVRRAAIVSTWNAPPAQLAQHKNLRSTLWFFVNSVVKMRPPPQNRALRADHRRDASLRSGQTVVG